MHHVLLVAIAMTGIVRRSPSYPHIPSSRSFPCTAQSPGRVGCDLQPAGGGRYATRYKRKQFEHCPTTVINPVTETASLCHLASLAFTPKTSPRPVRSCARNDRGTQRP